jgi:hypothetical protein
MMWLYYLNEMMAALALAVMGWATLGYVPHIRRSAPGAGRYMQMFVCGIGLVQCARTAWWDLLRVYLGVIGWMAPTSMALPLQLLNAGFNLGVAISGYLALKALHLSLPMAERAQFNAFSIVWYPREISLRNLFGGAQQ